MNGSRPVNVPERSLRLGAEWRVPAVAGLALQASVAAEGDRVVNAPLKRWPAGALNRPWSKTFVGGQGVDGVLAEQVVYPAEALCKLPQHLTLEEGSTLTVAGFTPFIPLIQSEVWR